MIDIRRSLYAHKLIYNKKEGINARDTVLPFAPPIFLSLKHTHTQSLCAMIVERGTIKRTRTRTKREETCRRKRSLTRINTLNNIRNTIRIYISTLKQRLIIVAQKIINARAQKICKKKISYLEV